MKTQSLHPTPVCYWVCLLFFVCVTLQIVSCTTSDKEVHKPELTGEILFEKAESFIQLAMVDSGGYYLQKAILLFQREEKWEAYLECLAHLAFVQLKCNQLPAFQASMQQIMQAVKVHGLEDSQSMKYVYQLLGYINTLQGNFEEGKSNFEQALHITKQHFPENHIEMAEAYSTFGNYYFAKSAYIQAQMYTEMAISILKEKLTHKDTLSGPELNYIHNSLGTLYNNLAAIAGDRGLNRESRRLAERGLSYRMQAANPDQADLVLNYNTLGTIFVRKGDFETGESYYLKAFQLGKEINCVQPMVLPGIQANLSEVYMEMRDYSRAVASGKEALSLLRQAGFGATFNAAMTTILLANIYREMGEPDSADWYRKQAESIMLSNSENKRQFSLLNGYMGLWHFDMGNFSMAKHFFQQQLEVELEIGDSQSSNNVKALRNIGHTEVQLRNFSQAYRYFYRAAALLHADTNMLKKHQLPPLFSQISSEALVEFLLTLENLANARRREALIYEDRMDLWQEDLAAHQMVLTALDSMRLVLTEDLGRAEMTNLYRHIFENGIEASLKLYNLTSKPQYLSTAWYFMEKGKGSLLLAGIRASQIAYSDSLVSREMDIRQQLAANRTFINQLESKRMSHQVDSLIEVNFKLKQQQEALRKSMLEKFPVYSKNLFDVSIIGLDSLREHFLKENEAFISYHYMHDELYAMAVTNDTVSIKVFYPDTRLDSLLLETKKLSKGYNSNIALGEWKPAFYQLAFALYQVLIGPFEEIIAEKKLIISPSSELYDLPFEMLITEMRPEPDQIALKEFPFLLKKYPIRYAFSATVHYERLPAAAPQRPAKVLGIAPLHFEGYPSLEEGRKELEAISQYYPIKKLMGSQASEAAFKEEAPHFSIVHISTHAIPNLIYPLNAHLLLHAEEGSKEDGQLKLSEIYGLPLNLDMVVLAACQTSEGPDIEGEGTISLGRGFRYAGAKSVIMTHWQASDIATQYLLGLFYKHLAAGKPKDEALRQAKLDMLEEAYEKYENPYYWANFVLYGAPDALIPARKNNWWWVGGIVLFLIGMYGFLRIKNRQV